MLLANFLRFCLTLRKQKCALDKHVCQVDIEESAIHKHNMDEEKLSRLVGQRVRSLRLRNDLNQQALAESVGISRASVANIETGRQPVSLINLYKLADTFRVDLIDLLPAASEVKTAKKINVNSSSELTDKEKEDARKLYLSLVKSQRSGDNEK